MARLMQRWKNLSRAMKWAVLALLGLALFFGVIDPVMNWTRDQGIYADIKAEKLRELQSQAKQRSEATAMLRRAARLFGEVSPPDTLSAQGTEDGQSFDARVSTASQKINRILSRNDAGSVDFSSRAAVSLGSGALSAFITDKDKEEARRVAFDVSFSGTPEQVATILAELERVPEIAKIGDVRLDRVDARGARLVSASLSPEVWGIAQKEGRSR